VGALLRGLCQYGDYELYEHGDRFFGGHCYEFGHRVCKQHFDNICFFLCDARINTAATVFECDQHVRRLEYIHDYLLDESSWTR
jgi:hypothetical protein